MKKVKEQVLYAFWGYDLCPYVLSGIVESFENDGKIVPEGYGRMIAVKPLAIIPDDAGKKAQEVLASIRKEYAIKEKALKKQYKNAALKTVGLEVEE